MVALRTIGKFSSGFVQLISTNLNVLLLGFLQNSILGVKTTAASATKFKLTISDKFANSWENVAFKIDVFYR